jgi:hypothetical protein
MAGMIEISMQGQFRTPARTRIVKELGRELHTVKTERGVRW